VNIPPPANHHPTIFDVALRSGVSPTTVSHVLNGTRFVANGSRQRVLMAVEELGYQPNAAARSLRSRRRRIIGLLVTNLQNRGFAALLEGIDQVMAQAGYSIIVSASRGDPDVERAAVRMLREQRVDGLILAGSAGAADDMLLGLHATGLPMVCINRTPTALPLDQVTVDYAGAARVLASHLLALGHRQFALLGGGRSPDCHPLLDGWYAALADQHVPAACTTSYVGVSREEIGYQLAHEALRQPVRPTAIVTGNSPLAGGALLACQELGLAIPEQVSLATLGDGVWMQVAAPPLTAVQDAAPEFGTTAAHFLLDRLAGTLTGPPRLMTVPATLVVRRSTGYAPPRLLASSVERSAAV
jgi:LacI family transcriptional regulator